MTRTRAESVVHRRDPVRGPPERTRYEPCENGDWLAFDEVWTGCAWSTRGRRRVESIGFKNVPPETVDETLAAVSDFRDAIRPDPTGD
jgi:hypothetical protein